MSPGLIWIGIGLIIAAQMIHTSKYHSDTRTHQYEATRSPSLEN